MSSPSVLSMMTLARGLIGLWLLVLSPVLALQGKPAELGLVVGAGALLLFFANIDRFASFKAGAVEAKLREADAALDAVRATNERLRKVAGLLGEAALASLTWTGRLHAPGVTAEKHRLRNDLEAVLREMDAVGPEVDRALREFRKLHSWDHLIRLLDDVRRANTDRREAASALSGWTKELGSRLTSEDRLPAPGEVRQQIECLGLVVPPSSEPLLLDYGHYREKGVLRRPDDSV